MARHDTTPRKDLERKRKRTRITPEIHKRMTDLRRQGSTYKKIAREIGIALQTVALHMRAEGLGGRRKRVTEEMMEEMKSLRDAGLSKKRIAEKLNLPYVTVFRYLRREEGFFGWVKRKMGLR